MEITLPWTADPDNPRHIWAKGCLSLRDYKESVRIILPNEKMEQVEGIYKQANKKTRNWCVCFSRSPMYIRGLYPYIAAAWIYTNRQAAYIMEVSDLISTIFIRDEEQKAKSIDNIINVGLLIIPDIGNAVVSNVSIRSQLYNLLARRKAKNNPLITDFAYENSIDTLHGMVTPLKTVQEVLGRPGTDLLSPKNATFIRVKNK